jgi:hypothetical protein
MPYHKELIGRYRSVLADQRFRVSTFLSIIALLASTVINYFAGTYATKEASNSVTDIILSNTHTYDVDGYFIYGALFLTLFITYLCFTHPKRIAFTVHSLTLFIIIRSVFVTLTHIGTFPSQIPLNLGSIASKFLFGGQLFFSGHTGIPFLMALIFWQEKKLRYIFLVWSVFFAIVVLLGHLHYTIDVFAAYFITYSIYHISLWLFPKDHAVLVADYNK